MQFNSTSISEFIQSAKTIQTHDNQWSDELQASIKNRDSAIDEYMTCTEALSEIKHMVEAIQHSTYGQIERLVTHCLQFVFGDEYSCSIVTNHTSHGVTAEVVVIKGDLTLSPMSSCGGGVVDIVSFALRLAALVGDARQSNRRILILDEPFRFLSAEYKPKVAALVEDIAIDFDFQIVLITLDDEFRCGLIHKVG